MYVSIGRLDSELLSNSMKVSRGGIIMKSHCCDADTYNRKVGLFLRNARVSFIMQSTVSFELWEYHDDYYGEYPRLPRAPSNDERKHFLA